jgi:peptidoglycan/LPS O-acetylase OafA/YrhL
MTNFSDGQEAQNPTVNPDATDAHSRYRSVRYFANLDGLRFVCIAMVLWHHAIPIDLPNLKLEGRGFLGVDFFFVLSGYLITTLLLREASRSGSFSLRDFYIRRAIRIIPVYFFVVSAVALYYIVLKGERQYLELVPYYYLFLSNYLVDHIPALTPTWSLSVEEQYYLIWPLLLMVLPARWIVATLALLIALNVLMLTGWFALPAPISIGPLLLRMPNSSYAPILMGSLAAVILHRRSLFDRIWPMASNWFAPLLGVVSLIVAAELLPSDLRGVPYFVIHSIMMFIVISLVVKERNVFSGFLTNRLVARIGVISYGICLYHMVARELTEKALAVLGAPNPWFLLLGYSVVTYVIAEVSFRTLERYFHRFRPRARKDVQEMRQSV